MCAAAFLWGAAGVTAQNVEILEDVKVRAEPTNEAPFSIVAVKGDIVPLVERNEQWYKIEYKGEQGWIFGKYARLVTNGKAADLFTKQDVSALPPVPIEDERTKVRYARVIENNTHIFANLDEGPQYAPVLYTARRKGDYFVLIGEGKSWCKVVYQDTTGWIKRSGIEIVDDTLSANTILITDAKMFLSVLGIVGAVIFIIVAIVTLRHIRAGRRRNVFVQKNALIIAKESKMVQFTLTNAMGPIERCFTEIGFNVNLVKDSVTARNSIEHSMPDIILVDWNFETAIFAKIENLFSRLSAGANTHFLFFNVPDPSAAPKSNVLKNINFLGITVSDRDIFQVVTPLLVHHAGQSANDIQKSVQRCALEGEIAGGNLLEVLQFIEIGSRTGCLMVETKGPFGLVYFQDGRIVYAAAAKGQGVEAVYDILNLPSGKFRFITNKQPKTANLNLPTLSVLMEWTKEKDEARRR
jgi:SH3-like domain-containing protein